MAAQRSVPRCMLACVALQLCLSEVLPAAADTGRNYYELLNVEPTATDSQIRRNFRELAVKYHPDKNKSAGAEKTFREIAEAYKVLSNKEKRRLYDSVGHETFLNSDAPGEPEDDDDMGFFFNIEDILHDFDGSPFAEQPYFHWSFHQDGDDEAGYSFEDPNFGFYFGDGDENEENHFF